MGGYTPPILSTGIHTGFGRRRGWLGCVPVATALIVSLAFVLAAPAGAEQASDPAVPAAGWLDLGEQHSCSVLPDGSVRCWGNGSSGQLGYGPGTADVGAANTPAQQGPVNLGPGQTALAIAAGDSHTCAILQDQSVKCWGFGGNGRLGYGNADNVTDPSTVAAVDLGGPAKAITAGGSHTCAILVDGSVHCWGFGGNGFSSGDGRLGYGNTNNVGDGVAADPSPAAAGAVKLGTGRTAVAITAGEAHTCAILDNGNVLCWGLNTNGQLGYGNTAPIGSTPTTTPDTATPVALGQKAIAISAGGYHTCAVLADGSVDCWGSGAYGELGYGNVVNVGDGVTSDPSPSAAGAVNLGGSKATAITSGDDDTCAILVGGSVKCWGWGEFGRLGYPTLDSLGNQPNIGDGGSDQSVAASAPVDLGAGRTAVAISAGGSHTCALLDNASVRCWGANGYGQLGYCNTDGVGETDTPGSVGPVNLQLGDSGQACPSSGGGPPPGQTTLPPPPPAAKPPATTPADLAAQAQRAKTLRQCLASVKRVKRSRRAAARAACLRRFARTPGALTGVIAGGITDTAIAIAFFAPSTNGASPPPAKGYIIKLSRKPIRTWRQFQRAQTLCGGDCVVHVTTIGDYVFIAITGLKKGVKYYVAAGARDNVSLRCGPHVVVSATPGILNMPDTGAGMHGTVDVPPLPFHPAPPCQRS